MRRELIAAGIGLVAIILIGIQKSASYVIIDGQPVRVEQGPAILVQLIYGYSEINMIIILVISLAVIGISYRSYRQNGLTNEIQAEMKDRAVLMACIVALTLISVHLLPFPYMIDVAVGSLGGFGLAHVMSKFII